MREADYSSSRYSSTVTRKDAFQTRQYQKTHEIEEIDFFTGNSTLKLRFEDDALNWLFFGSCTDRQLKTFGFESNQFMGWWLSFFDKGLYPSQDLYGNTATFSNMGDVAEHVREFMGPARYIQLTRSLRNRNK